MTNLQGQNQYLQMQKIPLSQMHILSVCLFFSPFAHCGIDAGADAGVGPKPYLLSTTIIYPFLFHFMSFFFCKL